MNLSQRYNTEGGKMKERQEYKRDYDLEATREKFLATGRMARPYARTKGIPEESFSKFLYGQYVPLPGSRAETRYLKALQEDGLLVSLDDDQERAA